MQDFRHLKCWQRAHALAIALHKLSRRFTRGGYARLRAQLTGAADSIGDNIVEGCGASTRKDFAKFLADSIKSANQTEGHLLKARDLDLISLDEWQRYSVETIEIRKMGLRLPHEASRQRQGRSLTSHISRLMSRCWTRGTG